MRQGFGDDGQHVIHAVLGLQQLGAALGCGQHVGRVETIKHRQHAGHVADGGKLIVGHQPIRGRCDDHDIDQGFLDAERLAHCGCTVLLNSFKAQWVMLRQAAFKKGSEYLCLCRQPASRV